MPPFLATILTLPHVCESNPALPLLICNTRALYPIVYDASYPSKLLAKLNYRYRYRPVRVGPPRPPSNHKSRGFSFSPLSADPLPSVPFPAPETYTSNSQTRSSSFTTDNTTTAVTDGADSTELPPFLNAPSAARRKRRTSVQNVSPVVKIRSANCSPFYFAKG